MSHIRDTVRLRTMSLAGVLVPGAPPGRKGWELSRLLLEAVESLAPLSDAGDYWPKRRYDLLRLRYVNSLCPDEVANRLAISRRHFYRQLQRALDEFADYVRMTTLDGVSEGDPRGSPRNDHQERLELLGQESAWLLDSPQRASLDRVLGKVLDTLLPLLTKRSVEVTCDLAPTLAEVPFSPEILKQFLMGLVGNLLTSPLTQSISLTATSVARGTLLVVTAGRHAEGDPAHDPAETSPFDQASAELAMLHGVRMECVESSADRIAYAVILPAAGLNTILVVDDNEDVCLLFRRYLISGGYQPLVAQSGQEAVALARAQSLFAITLDLMMNNEDGWDVLQKLAHDPRTADVPIVICSVLDHEELALMLGATIFLKKPVMREALLNALETLRSDSTQVPASP